MSRGIQLTQAMVRPASGPAPLCQVNGGTNKPALNITVTGPPGYAAKTNKQAIVQYATIGNPTLRTGPLPFMAGVDRECSLITTANNYRVPPNISKAQIQQEGADFNAKYRYEPSTIDFQQISGEYSSGGGVFAPGGPRKITTAPWSLYALAGSYLLAYQNPSDRAAFAPIISVFSAAPQDGKTFNLGSMAKAAQNIPAKDFPPNLQRQVAYPDVDGYYLAAGTDLAKACLAAKMAPQSCICPPAQAKSGACIQPRTLNLVWNQNLWTKFGNSSCPKPQALLSTSTSACVAYPNGKTFSFSATLGASEFAVDYRNMTATFGGLQGNGDAVAFSFEPIGVGITDAEQSPQSVVVPLAQCAGQQQCIVNNNPPNPSTFGGGYAYNPGTDTIESFFVNNLGSQGRANVLTGTTSDKQLPFTADSSGYPLLPVDPRYHYTTAQYYDAATYGPLQVGIAFWYGPTATAFTSAYDISDQNHPLWNLATNWGTAVDLGGRVHSYTMDPVNGIAIPRCGVYDPTGSVACNSDAWRNMWLPVLTNYNGLGPAAADYAKRILGVASHEFDPDFLAGCYVASNCPPK